MDEEEEFLNEFDRLLPQYAETKYFFQFAKTKFRLVDFNHDGFSTELDTINTLFRKLIKNLGVLIDENKEKKILKLNKKFSTLK